MAGGGFLKGSNAQEESLARASTLCAASPPSSQCAWLKCNLASSLNSARVWLYVGNHVEPEEKIRTMHFPTLAAHIYPKSRY